MGEEPTAADAILAAARDQLAPDKSIDKIETNAKFLLGSVAVIGSLLTGLGVFTSDRVSAHPAALLPTILLTAGSLSLAALALVPHGGDVALGDLASVQRFYDKDIRARGRLVQAAGVLFGLAVLASAVPAVVLSLPARATGPYVATDFERSGTAESLGITVTEAHQAVDSQTVVAAYGQRGTSRTLLLLNRAHPDATGALNIHSTLAGVGKLHRIAITTTLTPRHGAATTQRLAFRLAPLARAGPRRHRR